MKKVYSAMNPTKAQLLRGILESEDIEAMVRGEFLWTARGEVPITTDTAPSVWIVNAEDYEHAMEIVEEFKAPENSDDLENKDWQCSKYNETNEGQFTECWNCGTPRQI